MQVIITACNHDSASRQEAPRPLLTRYHVALRGNVRKIWKQGESEDDDKTGGHWFYSFDDLIIPVTNEAGEEVIILAVRFLRLGNLFHGHDRLPEHKHFLKCLLEQIAEQKPDALLIA